MRPAAFTILLLAIAFPAEAADIAGRASVIDGDTIEIHGQRIRLHGIDAPEGAQQCERDGEPWPCGRRAAFALADTIGARTVTCNPRDRDRYGRIVAVCFAGSENLNAWMVRQGWALAYRRYSKDYIADEDAARQQAAGMWAGDFTPPWDWRRGQRTIRSAPVSERPDGCDIKGNISRNGERIYHMPGERWYDRTVIDTAKDERWFCTQDEAEAAGWRRARR
jgi:endonuclease YncB( thermonuclease family)